MTLVTRTITTAAGGTAVEIETPPTEDGTALTRALGLPPSRGTLIVNGSTASTEAGRGDLAEVMAAVAAVAVADRLTVVTGATDAGIFSMLGSEMVAATAPLVGVAPLGLVTWSDCGAGSSGGEPLEGHHSHFVLVEGTEWGVETGTMLALAEALGRSAPSAAVLCGGGDGARVEVLGHVRAGRPVVVLAGSGRLADALAAALDGTVPADESLSEVIEKGHLLVCPLTSGADALAATLRRLMAAPP